MTPLYVAYCAHHERLMTYGYIHRRGCVMRMCRRLFAYKAGRRIEGRVFERRPRI